MDYSNLQSRASTSSLSSNIPPHRTQIHPRLIKSYSATSPNPKIQIQFQYHKWIVLVSSLLTLPFVFYLFSTARKVHIHRSTRLETTPPWKAYGVVIQTGATRSKVHVLEIDDVSEAVEVVDVSVLDSEKVWVENYAVKRTVLKLVDFAKGRVPEVSWGRTKVLIFAGEEDIEGLSDGVREGIMESCREVLRSSGFWFKNEWANFIKGVDRGVFAWAAVNYDLGTLGFAHQETIGVVKLGGHDMQVVFALKDPKPTQFSRSVQFGGVIYYLHAQSLPQYGCSLADLAKET